MRSYRWEDLDDRALLRLRFRDLHLRTRGSAVWPEIEDLYADLEGRGIRFRPHVWLSTDWFSPDGVPGIGVPFYAAHPRLRRLERRMMGEVEGGTRKWRLRILRHEAGHALDTAYGLRRRADWRATFGRASQPYPSNYRARPDSRNHVLHLGCWYAQSHPTEDFAETFAVWLQPRSRWRRDYAGWPALAKLEYVDALMDECAGEVPRNRDRSVVAPLGENGRTINEYYRRKQASYAHVERRYDGWLMELFVTRTAPRSRATRAARFIREARPRLRRSLIESTLAGPYLVDHVIETITGRVRQLDLVLRGSRRENEKRILQLLEQVLFDMLYRNRESYAL
jgi:Putative zinc-binding metallo-peptidase